MKPSARDGVISWNGLTAEFRFVAPANQKPDMSWVDTAVGSFCVRDELLTYDPVRDLTPEAAALVEQTKEATFQGVLGKLTDLDTEIGE